MKKILAVAIALVMVLALTPMIASANVTEVFDETGLITAMNAGGNVQLGANILIDDAKIPNFTSAVVLDLYGHTMTFNASDINFVGENASLTVQDTSVTGTGKISSTGGWCLCAGGGAEMIINSGTIEAVWYGLFVHTGAKLTVNGGSVLVSGADCQAICGNGSASYAGATTITINGGVIEAEYGSDNKSVQSLAIYHPHAGTLNINGGQITGGTGITMLAGTLNMTGGTVTGTANGSPVYNNSNGSKGSGSALCLISNDDYAGNIVVNIEGGVLNSCYTYAIDGFSYKNTTNPDETNVTSVAVGEGATLTTPMASAIIAVESHKLTIDAAANIQTGVTSLVRANASPTFTIIIPALVDFGELTNSGLTLVQPFNVELTNALLEPGAQVEVSVVSDFTMDNGGGGTRAYTVTNEAKTKAVSGNIYVTFTGNDIDEGTAACDDNILQAGAYTDTMVFSVFYRP